MLGKSRYVDGDEEDEEKRAEACFSKAPETLRARKAIFR